MKIHNDRLWYKQSARTWNEALPIGNGRLGAMLFGGEEDVRIQINEDTLWTGKPPLYENPHGPEALKKAQQLSLAGRQKEAQDVLEKEFCTGLWSQMYMPLCDIRIRMQHAGTPRKYTRALDMSRGVHTVEYTVGNSRDTRIRRECFISWPDQALVLRMTADKRAKLSFTAHLEPALLNTVTTVLGKDLLLTGHAPLTQHTFGMFQGQGVSAVYGDKPENQGIGYAARLHVTNEGGKVMTNENGITVSGATAVTMIFAARTSFAGWDRHPVLQGVEYVQKSMNDLTDAMAQPYETLLERHVKDHRKLYDRMRLDLGGDEEEAALPTDERLRRHKAGQRENGLYTLLFNHAKYCTIAAGREGTQPMNLQGIWNDSTMPPWHSNYTLNINTEMNYWPTLRMGLHECMQPLLGMIADLTESGQWTAQQYYGARGAVAHHNTDLWRMSTPVGAGVHESAEYAFWPFGLCWLSRSAWEHYLYTRDENMLRTVGYPALRASALFLMDTMIQDKGEWIFCPATSSEHWYWLDDEKKVGAAVDRTTGMMQQIAIDVFENCLKAEKELGIRDLMDDILKKLPHVRGLVKDSEGRIAEFDGDRPDGERQHRHVSHLYALFPAQQVSPEVPEWMEAAKNVLLSRGDEGTGWAMAWKINLWARLREGDHALKLLSNQLMLCVEGEEDSWQAGGTYANMFCAHPPFQIDGNFGAASGIMEMLCQVEADGHVTLLPALPAAWQNGEVRGLRLPGGKMLNMRWENGQVAEHEIVSAE